MVSFINQSSEGALFIGKILLIQHCTSLIKQNYFLLVHTIHTLWGQYSSVT